MELIGYLFFIIWLSVYIIQTAISLLRFIAICLIVYKINFYEFDSKKKRSYGLEFKLAGTNRVLLFSSTTCSAKTYKIM